MRRCTRDSSVSASFALAETQSRKYRAIEAPSPIFVRCILLDRVTAIPRVTCSRCYGRQQETIETRSGGRVVIGRSLRDRATRTRTRNFQSNSLRWRENDRIDASCTHVRERKLNIRALCSPLRIISSRTRELANGIARYALIVIHRDRNFRGRTIQRVILPRNHST